MARVKIPDVVQDVLGNALQNASVQVNKRAGGAATVYADASTGTTIALPLLTGLDGAIPGWLDPGSYNLISTHAAIPGSPRTSYLEAVSAASLQTSVTNAISPMDYGAAGDGVTDDQTKIANCFAAAKAQNRPVILDRVYRHSGGLTIDSITVFGYGDSCELQAANPSAGAVTLTGTMPQLLNVKITCPSASTRIISDAANGVTINNASRFRVIGCHVARCACVGIVARYGASYGVIMFNQVENTYADGIGAAWDGSNHILCAFNHVFQSGDDPISVESYYTGTTGAGVLTNTSAREIVIMGNEIDYCPFNLRLSGAQILAIGNTISNGQGAGGGIQIDAWGDVAGLSSGNVTDIMCIGNSVRSPANGRHGIAVAGRAGNGGIVRNVTILGNVIDSVTGVGDAINLNLGYMQQVLIAYNQCYFGQHIGIRIGENAAASPPVDVTVDNNVLMAIGGQSIYSDTVQGLLRVRENIIRDANPVSAVPLIQLFGNPAITQVLGNVQLGGAGAANALLNTALTNVDARGNQSQSGLPVIVGAPARYFRSRRVTEATATPAAGTWSQGDVVFNSVPAANGKIGWVCTASGTPGTWKPWGAIDA